MSENEAAFDDMVRSMMDDPRTAYSPRVRNICEAIDIRMFGGTDMMRAVEPGNGGEDATDEAGNSVTRFYTYPPLRGPSGELVLAFADITPAEFEADDFADLCIKVCTRMVRSGEELLARCSDPEYRYKLLASHPAFDGTPEQAEVRARIQAREEPPQ